MGPRTGPATLGPGRFAKGACALAIALLDVGCAAPASRPTGEVEGASPSAGAAPLTAGDAGNRERPLPPAESPPTCTAFVREGVLRRSALVRVVDAGLGQWLRGVDVRPTQGKGRFRGWLIERLYPDNPCFRRIDLQPGDVVTRINDHSIERPEEANELFLGLRSAPALKVDYVRDRKPRSLLLTIAED